MTTIDNAMLTMMSAGELGRADPPFPPDGEDLRWADLARRVARGERQAMEELYREFSRGVRFSLCRHLGPQDADDRVHDVFLIVVEAIRRGDLRDPSRLPGFIRTIARRHVASSIGQMVQVRRDHLDLEQGEGVADSRQDAERDLLHWERCRVMRGVLTSLSDRDQQVLTRFYLDGQSVEQICDEMGLTEVQFRLLKSRAKARFGEAGRKRLLRDRLSAFVTGTVMGRSRGR